MATRTAVVAGTATAVSGRTAVQAVQAARRAGRPVDLVLLDVNLPDMSGLDVARTLRARGETVDLLVITAHRDVATVRAASTLGVVGYLIKPFTLQVFQERMQAYAAQRDKLRRLSARKATVSDQGEVDRTLRLQDGSEEPLDPTTVSVDPAGRKAGWCPKICPVTTPSGAGRWRTPVATPGAAPSSGGCARAARRGR